MESNEIARVKDHRNKQRRKRGRRRDLYRAAESDVYRWSGFSLVVLFIIRWRLHLVHPVPLAASDLDCHGAIHYVIG